MKEVNLKRVAGPFEEIPYKNFIPSPAGLVPKKSESTKPGDNTRSIFHFFLARESNIRIWIMQLHCVWN